MAEQTSKESRRAVPPYSRSSTAAISLPETSLDCRDPYKEGVHHFQRRLPSPGSIRSDCEEVSDEDNLSERIQSLCENHTQLLNPQHCSARVGSDTSSTPLVMDDVPYLIGYPEGDFVEESDQAVHTLPASNRSLSPETSPNDSFSHNGIVNMGAPTTGVHPTLQNDSLGHSKVEASVEDQKRSFLYQSSSGEDEDSSNDGRHDETKNDGNGNDESIRPSSPQVSSRPPWKSMPQQTPTEFLQARPRPAKLDPIQAAYRPKPPGEINLVRIAQAIARKNLKESVKKSSKAPANDASSSRYQYTTNDVSTGRQNPMKGPGVGASGTSQSTFERPQALQAGSKGGATENRSSPPSISESKNQIQIPSGAEPVPNGLPIIEPHISSSPASRGPVRTGTPSTASRPETPINRAKTHQNNTRTSTSVVPQIGPSGKAPQRVGPTTTKKPNTITTKVVQSNAPASSIEAQNTKQAPTTGTNAMAGPLGAKKTASSLPTATCGIAGPSKARKTAPSQTPVTHATAGSSMVKKTTTPRAPATQATNGLSDAKKTTPSKAPATHAVNSPSNAQKTARTPATARKPPSMPPTSLVMRDMLEEINGGAALAAAKPPTNSAPPKDKPATKSASRPPKSTAATSAATPLSKKSTPVPTPRSQLPNHQPTSPYPSKVETPHHSTTPPISSPETITPSNTSPAHSPSKIKNEPTTPPSISTFPSSPFQTTKPRAHNPKVHIRRPSGPTDFDIFIPPAPGVHVPARSVATEAHKGGAASGDEALGGGRREAMPAAPGPNVPARSATTAKAVPAQGATPRGEAFGGEKEVSIWDAAVTKTVDEVSGCSKDGNVGGVVSRVDESQRGSMRVAEVEGGERKVLNRQEMRKGGGMDTEREGKEVRAEGSGMVVVGDKSRNGEKDGAAGGEKIKKVPKNVVRFPKKKVEQKEGNEALTLLIPTPQAHSIDTTTSISTAVKATPNPLLEPYFIYRIKQKTWSASSSEEHATATTLGCTSTVLETANREAEELFTQLKNQFTSSFAVQHKTSTSSHDDDGCLEAKGTLSSIGWPAGDVFFKVWVERGTVPAEVVPFHPPPQHTPFLRKTLYIIRLYKLTKAPPTRGAEGANTPADRPKETSSSESDEEDSAADSGPDVEGNRRKRQAEDAPSDLRPSKRSRIAATPATQDTFLRTHQEIACPEVYTTLADANAAACNLQISIMQTTTPLREDQRVEAVARLKGKVVELGGKQGGEGYWQSEFPVGFSGRSKFEMVVERVGVCGPRNV